MPRTSLNARAPLADVLRELYARVPRGMRLGLEPMRVACTQAGNPERAFAVAHVAGTNGKGSVAAMVEAMARAAGLRTGLYTSPHLVRFAERIRIDGEPLPDGRLAELVEASLVAGPELSFFEAATLAAFVAFREAQVELAVLEVGLGGRLDATNVVEAPRVTAITRIALDHTDRLGATEPQIAREKAGIAKPGVPLVLGPVGPDVRFAIDQVAFERGGSTRLASDDVCAVRLVDGAALGLAGAFQRDNAIVACCMGRLLGIDDDACLRGLECARWPGRVERIDDAGAQFLLDAAHNPDGARALAAHLATLAHRRDDTLLVFGALADKSWAEMLDALAPCTDARLYAPPSLWSRELRAAASPAAMRARYRGDVVQNAEEAVLRARRWAAERRLEGRSPLVVVAGSIYLVGEIRARLLGLSRDPPVAL